MMILTFRQNMSKSTFMRFAILFIYICLMFAFSPPSLVQAQQPTPSDDDVNGVARGLYCPVCENIPLDVCPTQACAQWRELIRLKLSEGWSKEQIEQYFVAQYGDRVLAEPPRRGLNWLVYLVPPLFILVAVYILARIYARIEKTPAEPVPAAPASDDEYLQKVDAEIKKRE